MIKIHIDEKELKNYFDYLLDKIEDVYYDEVKRSIERFIKENTTK